MADPLRQTYGEVFFLTNGLQRDPYGLANFHPASNVNRLDVYLEDGVSTNVVMVNFRADGKNFPTSVFFPTLYGGTVQKVITGEATARTFAKYSLLVPPQVLQWNANGSAPLGLTATVVQTAGDGLLGAFATYTELTTTHTATQILYDDGAIAYVYSTEGVNEYGFYMVSYDSGTDTYSWVEVNNPVTQINMVDTKQYNIVGMQIQKGNLPSPTHGVTISDAYIRYILAYLAQINDIALANKALIGDKVTQDAYIVGATPLASDWLSLTDGGSVLTPVYGTFYVILDGASAGDDAYVGLEYIWNGTAYAQYTSTYGTLLYRMGISEYDIDAIIAGTQNITYDPTISGLVATTIKTAIDEVAGMIADMKDGTDAFTKIAIDDGSGNIAYITYTHTNGNYYQVLDITYPDGRVVQLNEQIEVNYRNTTGGTVNSGAVLIANGVTIGNQAVNAILFDEANYGNYELIGVSTVDGISVNSKSKATRLGIVTSIAEANLYNTGTAYAEGQTVWARGGKLSNIAPAKPNAQVRMGIVINKVSTNYDVLIFPQVLPLIDSLSNVTITSGATDDVLIRNSSGIWVNSQRLKTAENDIDTLETVKENVANKATTMGTKNDTLYPTTKAVGDYAVEKTSNPVKTVTVNPTTYVVTVTYYNDSVSTYDLPAEMAFVSASYDNNTKDLTFTLQNGSTVVVPLDDIITGLATETWVTSNFYSKTQLDAGQLDNRYYTEDEADALLGTKIDEDLSNYIEKLTLSDNDKLPINDSDNGDGIKYTTFKHIKDQIVIDGEVFDASVDYAQQGLGSFKTASTKIYTLTLQLSGDYRTTIRIPETDTFVWVKFPDTSANANLLRVSLNNGTNYYNVIKNGARFKASIVSGQLVRLQFDGTQFIADIHNDVAVTETYGKTIESTYGLFNPQFEGIPLVKEIQGFTLSAPQLVTNGDFSNGTTGWIVNGQVTVVSSQAQIDISASITFLQLINTYTNEKHYLSFKSYNNGNGALSYNMFDAGAVKSNTYTPTLSISKTFYSSILTNTANGTAINISRSGTTGIVYVDDIMLFNISTLIANKQYSPMFNTTFDLMTDANIKLQMDAWVQEGVLPYDGVQHVENTQLKSVGVNQFNRASWVASYGYKIPVKASTVYTWSESIAYKLYDDQQNEVASGTASTVTTTSTARYISFNTITNTSTFMLVEGATLPSSYLSHITETQLFNHGRLSRLPNGVHDKVRYENGAWVLDRYISENTNVGIGAVINTTTLPTIKTTGTFMAIDNTTKALQYGSYGDTLTLSNASTVYFELATMTTSTLDVDGVLLQDTVTTVQQLQDLPTTYLLEYAMNTDQTTATLVQRDKVQQLEIDSLETRTTALETRKETNKEIIFMSATDWATYTRVDGEVYGVWDETTGVITFYYGVVGV